jgi:hypothetical protein
MEQSVEEDLLEHGIRATPRDELRIQIWGLSRADDRHLHAIQKFHRQDGRRAQRPADSRKAYGRIAGKL